MKISNLVRLPLLAALVLVVQSKEQVGTAENATSAPSDPTVDAVLTGDVSNGFSSTSEACDSEKIKQDPFIHKSSYTIGVHATHGVERSYEETHQVFSEYLTATAGTKFDPPIKFNVVPNFFGGLFDAIENEEMDFLYANPGVYACIGTQVGATALATVVSRLETRGRTFDLDVYGGVIAVRHDNDDINTIADLKDKIIGAGGIIDLMGGQMQIYEMERAGMSYVNDPKQVVFTKDQKDVVHGLLSGRFDVGFIRTDQIELTTDENGDYVDPDLFKIIEPKIFVMDSGELFPFLHSTDIFPEWPFAALPSVPRDVQQAVQDALMELGLHIEIGKQLQECLAANDAQVCASLALEDLVERVPCSADHNLALTAADGARKSHISGFRTARSYFELNTVLQDAGFLINNDESGWHCLRPDNLWEGITCPDGYFKRHEPEFLGGCEHVGLACNDKEDYDCFCKPCVKAFDVDVYPLAEGQTDHHLEEYYGDALRGCEKMSICGTIEQGESITLRVFDNLLREDPHIEVLAHAGDQERPLELSKIEGTKGHGYEFVVMDKTVQVQVIDIMINGKPISQSPIRIIVTDFNCEAVYGEGSHRVPDEEGNCVCAGNTYEMGSKCMESTYFFLIIFAAVFIVLGVLIFFYLGYKKKQSDSVWHVEVEELHFNEPPEIIGQGAFGVVILGQYRGTKVAVKRVLPPVVAKRRGSMSLTSSGQNLGTQSGEIVGSRSGSMEFKRQTTKRAVKKEEQKTAKNVKFGENSGDIESQTVSKTGSMQFSGSMSGSTNKEWERLMLGGHASDNDILRILESATASDHGSTSMMRSATASQSVFLRWMPMWARFDEHSRRINEFMTEMRLLSRLRHPCITTVMGAVVTNKVDPMLVMEYMEYGSLYDLLHNETMTPGGEIILQVIRDIVQGIQFLHASKPPILHGDLKAKNILVDSRFRAKVSDFGFSHIKTKKQRNVLQGTPFYMAPEYLRRRTEYTQACDIYSLAMIFYEIYARQSPFEGEDPRKILPKVCHPRLNKRPNIPEAMPPKMVELMKKCWSANAFFRPSSKDLDFALVELSSQDTEPLETAANKLHRELKEKQNKTMSLYDVFPKHVADALQAGKKVEAESHEIVTVFFSDIVGFTTISEQYSPMKISKMLDRLYHAFDELSRKHGIFKVETIGDAYMGVTNLEGNEFETHVKQVAEFSQDAIRAASNIMIDEDDPAMGYVQIRVGFHSGPVVSNVIGSMNPRYGLFGDTVNTASRMESNSMSGKIHCSHASAQLLKQQAPDIPINLRGMINVKGKGKMKTYWIGDDALLKPLAPNLNLSVPSPMEPLSERSEEDHIHHGDETEVNLNDEDDLSEDNSDPVSSNGQSPKGRHTRNGSDEMGKSTRTQDTSIMSESGRDSFSGSERDHYIKVHSSKQDSNNKPMSAKIQMDGSIQKTLDDSPTARDWPAAPTILE